MRTGFVEKVAFEQDLEGLSGVFNDARARKIVQR